MKKNTLIHAAPLLAAFAVAACGSQTESVNQTIVDPQEAELANAAEVVLPPSVKSSLQYRCKDNSLIFVDFFSDDTTVHLKAAKDGPVTVLKAPEVGQAFASEDGSKKIEGAGPEIKLNGQACKAG